jgi:hypothetical protein
MMNKKILIIGGVVLLVVYYLWSKGALKGLSTLANGALPATMTSKPDPVTVAAGNAGASVITSIGNSISNFFSNPQASSTPTAGI